MKQLSSTTNDIIRETRKIHQRKYRKESGLFITEGFHMFQEACDTQTRIHSVFVTPQAAALEPERIAALEGKGCAIYLVNDTLLKSVAQTPSPQGIVFVAHNTIQPYPGTQALQGRLVIALDALQDPGNVGTILRTAWAVGVRSALLGAGCADALGEKALRASMGAIFHMQLYETQHLPQALCDAGKAAWHIACAHLKGTDFFARESHERNILVVGSEGAGVSEAASAACHGLYTLPMDPGCESLNAAIAAGIMLYDLWRAP